MFEKMLDCTDKYAGEHRSEPSIVRSFFSADGQDNLETLFLQKLQFNREDSREICKYILEYWKKKKKELWLLLQIFVVVDFTGVLAGKLWT